MSTTLTSLAVGIDAVAIYTPSYYLPLSTLAAARGIDPEKFHVGLGQCHMAVPPPGEDIVTMAANAAQQVLKDIPLDSIEMLMFATESGIDQSKAAGLFVHELLQLSPHCRVIELKQACYAGTAGLQLALPYLRENPDKKILLIASDIACYGLNTVGESSQGAAAIAMILSANPRILALDSKSGFATESVMDFWRPNYSHEAFVDGKYSSKLYLTMLEASWRHYTQQSGLHYDDHDFFCYHTPVPRLVEKAHQHLAKIAGKAAQVAPWLAAELTYPRITGNSYTASLYINFISLLENHQKGELAGKRIGFYSYGSGCMAEFFSGIVQPHYQNALCVEYHQHLLASREALNYQTYEEFYSFRLNEEGTTQFLPLHWRTGQFKLMRMQNHQRQYEKVHHKVALLTSTQPQTSNLEAQLATVIAPGKLILSGEHAVLYGQPALAMAINRYVKATIKPSQASEVHFDFIDLAHHSELTLNALRLLKNKIKHKYQRFIRGEYSIRQVLQKPFELAQVALSLVTEARNFRLPHGLTVQVSSDIPIGCGLGSSAATIISVLKAISTYLDQPLSAEILFKLALEAENLQHGYSSGLDLHLAMHGGCLLMQDQQLIARPIPTLKLYVINTGTPQSTTGQCVEKARPFMTSAVLNEFASVTEAMDQAFTTQNFATLKHALNANHALLTNIGVVPPRVSQFIREIQQCGGAAKICGAGAVSGEAGGAVLVAIEELQIIEMLCQQYNYTMMSISGETRGMRAA